MLPLLFVIDEDLGQLSLPEIEPGSLIMHEIASLQHSVKLQI